MKMKRFHFGTARRSVFRTVLCAALALAMVVPANVFQLPVIASEETVAEAADVPDPIMTVDFDKGIAGEAAKNGAEVKKYDGILQFEELKDEKGNYLTNADGTYRYELVTDEPFIENSAYKYGDDGNQPTTYWDPQYGSVLMLDHTKKYRTDFIKTKSDELDGEHPVYTGGFDAEGNATGTVDPNSVLMKKTNTHSALIINNPFKGMDFSEPNQETTDYGRPIWTKGITIGYWVKAAVYELSDEQKGDAVQKNDSILFTFQNDSEEEVYNVNDLMKYEACMGYDATVTNGEESYTGPYSGDTYTADMCDLGDRTTVTDPKSGKSYSVASNYGVLVRFNKDFEGSSAQKVYFLDPKKSSGEAVKFDDADGNTVRLFDLEYQLYDSYHTMDMDQGSLIKRGKLNGSLSIAASNSFAFKEDDWRSEAQYDEGSTTPRYVAVEGPTQDNPNADEYGEITQFRHYNMFAFQGDGSVLWTETDANGQEVTQWHYVTCVIKNDWVDFYVDGEKMYEDDWYYSPTNGISFNPQCAGKYFNGGWGIGDDFYYLDGNISEWSADGTAKESPANKVARSMLDWIADDETVLMIGGQGSASEGLDGQDIGNADGTLIDDVTFYDVPLSEDQAIALYEQASADREEKAAAKPTQLAKYDFTSDTNHKMPANMQAASTNKDSVTAPEVVNDSKRGHVLKVYPGSASSTAGVEFTNPFAGQDLTGATVSYWYKGVAEKNGRLKSSINLSFVDEPKILEHNKIQDAQKETKSRTGLYTETSLNATFMAGYDTQVYGSLKNQYMASTKMGVFDVKGKPGYMEESEAATTEWNERTQSFLGTWHFVTMVVNNSGITMYYDGKQLPNRIIDNQKMPSFYGPRFFDGYYQRVNDGFAPYKLSSNNQGATPLMTFLTQADTKASIGVAYALGVQSFQSTSQGYYDNITYYAGDMNAEQVKELYDAELEESKTLGPVEGEEIEPDVVNPTESEDPNPKPTEEIVTPSEDPEGNLVAEANGVKVKAPKGSIPEDAQLVVAILGETEDADIYKNADSVLAGINGLQVKNRVLYNIYFTSGGQVVQPTAEVEVSITPPSGYSPDKVSVVSVDGKSLLNTSVSGGAVVFKTQQLGVFALVQVPDGVTPPGNQGGSPINGTTTGGNNSNTKTPSASGNVNASKTGDVTDILLPVMLLAAAAGAMILVRRKRVEE